MSTETKKTKTNQYTMICINFLENSSNPADFECHDIAQKGIPNLFFKALVASVVENVSCYTRHFQENHFSSGFNQKEPGFFLCISFYFPVNSLKVQCSAYA